MTIRELINKLLDFDLEAEVMLFDQHDNLAPLKEGLLEQINGGEIKREYSFGDYLSPYYWEREILILRWK